MGTQISNVGDNGRIFFLHGFTIFNCGIFGVRRFGKYFLGWLNLSSDLLRYSKQSKDSW